MLHFLLTNTDAKPQPQHTTLNIHRGVIKVTMCRVLVLHEEKSLRGHCYNDIALISELFTNARTSFAGQ